MDYSEIEHSQEQITFLIKEYLRLSQEKAEKTLEIAYDTIYTYIKEEIHRREQLDQLLKDLKSSYEFTPLEERFCKRLTKELEVSEQTSKAISNLIIVYLVTNIIRNIPDHFYKYVMMYS